jgi:hypothetical protein
MLEPPPVAASQASVLAVVKRFQSLLASPRAQRAWSWLSVVAVAAVTAAYLSVWTAGNWEMLSDPKLQNSDARTLTFAFHRYDREPALEHDPIAEEMLSYVPLAVHALYRVLVPVTDVFVAPKIVQALCVAIVLWAAVLVARSRRAGLGAGAVLLFVVLHDWFAVYRLASGLPRAFGFPLFALWLAGVLAAKRRVRMGAAFASALTYPSVMNLILAAEGLYACRQLVAIPLSVTLRRLKRYALLVACCALALVPSTLSSQDSGPVHTLAQAEQEPAFGRSGRLHVLPFDSPTETLGDAFIDPLRPRGVPLVPSLGDLYARDRDMSAVLLVGLLLLLPLLSITKVPWLALAFSSGSVVLYWLSRAFAFRLYSPERYYSFGMRMALMVLLALLLAQSFAYLRGRTRSIARNFLAAGFILLVWSFVGSGVVRKNGMTIDQRRDVGLHEFIAKLPNDVRIASHPLDGDGIPYYSARATMGTYETLQPWFVDAWRRQRARTDDTLRALYATDPSKVVDYCRRNRVTHFLIDKKKYKGDIVKRSASFEPFTLEAKAILADVDTNDLVFRNVPESAIAYQKGTWLLVDAARLGDAPESEEPAPELPEP